MAEALRREQPLRPAPAGVTPGSPRGLFLLARRTVAEAWNDRILGLSAEAGFWQLLSLPPLVLGVLGLIGFFAEDLGSGTVQQIQDHILSGARHVLAPDVVDTVVRPIVTNVLAGGRVDVASIGFILSLWSGSSATATYVNQITIAYNMRYQRGAWRSRLLALGIYLLGVAGGVVVLPLLIVGPRALVRLAPQLRLTVTIGYWPAVGLLSLVGLATLYHLAVPVRTAWHRDLPGAVLALVLWVVGSIALRYYIQAYFSRESVYGQLGAVVAALLFMYITALAVLFGAELNAEIDKLWPTAATATARRREHEKIREMHDRRASELEWRRVQEQERRQADRRPGDAQNDRDDQGHG